MKGHSISTTVSSSVIPSGETASHNKPLSSVVTQSPVFSNFVHCIPLIYVATAWSSHIDPQHIASLISSIFPWPDLTSCAYFIISCLPLHPKAHAALLPLTFPFLASFQASEPCCKNLSLWCIPLPSQGWLWTSLGWSFKLTSGRRSSCIVSGSWSMLMSLTLGVMFL